MKIFEFDHDADSELVVAETLEEAKKLAIGSKDSQEWTSTLLGYWEIEIKDPKLLAIIKPVKELRIGTGIGVADIASKKYGWKWRENKLHWSKKI